MTGPEHFAEAERLVELASSAIPGDDPAQAAVTARAWVHATLAAAAATAMASFSSMPMVDASAWDRVCGVKE